MMDWDRRRSQPTAFRIWQSGSRTLLLPALATFAVLLCLVPLVVGREIDTRLVDTDVVPLGPRGYMDDFSGLETHHTQHARKHHHDINRIDEQDTPSTMKEWSSSRKRTLHGRSKPSKQDQVFDGYDYDEIVDKHVSSSSSPSASSVPSKRANIVNGNLKYLEPDKKYFDYFPIEDVELSYDPKEDDIRVVLISGDESDEDVKRKKSKKFGKDTLATKKLFSHSRRKREASLTGYEKEAASDVESKGAGKTKRNAFHGPSYYDLFLQSQRGNYIAPNNFDYTPQIQGYQPNSYPSQGTPNDPWNNRFYNGLNNFYLPVPLPAYTPSTPVTKYPFPEIYQNPVVPPQVYIPPGQYLPQPPQRQPQPPSKLPQPASNSSSQNVNIADRFDVEDDRLIWDTSPINGRDQNPGSQSVNQVVPPRPSLQDTTAISSASALPTRRPAPPLIHRPESELDTDSATQRPATSSTRKPAPPLIHRPDTPTESRSSTPRSTEVFAPPASNALESGGIDGTFRPQPSRPNQRPPPPQRPSQSWSGQPQPQPQTPAGINGPSKCIWGTVSCCARRNLAIRYACFEQLGCHGAFWDRNPCSDEFQDAALQEISRFFDRK